MEIATEIDTTTIGVALSGLDTALATLIDVVEDGGLEELAVMGVVEAVRGFERIRNRMALVDHRIVVDCDRRRVGDELNLRNPPDLTPHPTLHPPTRQTPTGPVQARQTWSRSPRNRRRGPGPDHRQHPPP